MNTKTMRLPPRRVLTPSAAPNNNKRKERDEVFERPRPRIKPSPSPNTPTAITPTKFLKPDKPSAGLESPRSSSGKGLEPTSSNQLLAGFLAHEFLTAGTLFGEPWDPSRAAEGPTPTFTEADRRKGKSSQSQMGEAEPGKQGRYAELAELLRGNGTHIAGIVNPTQLSRFLHL
ncbi:hypothetical protein QN277_012831 [Acacia crassicarpa]|uniref:Uncharacterized protein n=1 Tax=Acacia crassicarpa TaxID=499986 RepID=A0AAE1N1B2_9FABA|nr:hypothetical protein QN277_012831 [Acacia crassicarpa]